jgi:formylglycine-generating enzyme required for sulfatase activity
MIKISGPKREPVIVDFGLAHRDDPEEARLTRSGQILGTIAYMAPEQIRGDLREIGPACDIYALGVILYELLAGVPPFRGTELAVAGQILTQDPQPPSAHRADLDRRLEAICLKAMAKSIGDRFASMGALAAALADVLKSPAGRPALAGPLLEPIGADPSQTSPLESPDPAEVGATAPDRVWPLRSLIVTATAGALGLFALGLAVWVATNKGRVTTNAEGPAAKSVPTQAAAREAAVSQGEKRNTTVAKPYAGSRTTPDSAMARDVSNSIGLWLRMVPSGEFVMGSPTADGFARDDEKPLHRVRISRSFYLGLYEVNLVQFRRLVEKTGFRTEAETDGHGGYGWNEEKGDFEQNPRYTWRAPGYPQTQIHPVGNVSWNDAIAFCNKLSELEGLKPYYQPGSATPQGGDGYRLPTEAEWEYACRAGTTTRFYSGDDSLTLLAAGNAADGTLRATLPQAAGSAGRDGFTYTAPFGQFAPNGFDLYDMHGNVSEWCYDGYEERYYDRSPDVDPLGPSNGALRVARDGAWRDLPQECRAAKRSAFAPGYRHVLLGFRIARGMPPDATVKRVPEKVKQAVPSPAAAAASTLPPKRPARPIVKQPESGNRTGPGDRPGHEITSSIGIRLREIPAGEFLMGSPDSDASASFDEKPQHRVRISRPFYLGVNEVTVGQFRRVVEASGYRTEAEKDGTGSFGWSVEKPMFEQNPIYTWRNPGFTQTEEHPVVNVTWNDAIAFCNKLSALEGLKPYYPTGSGIPAGGDGYRLPTEAEWEYACRAGTTTRYQGGDDPLTLLVVANTADATLQAIVPRGIAALKEPDGFAYTAPVGQFLPNAFGLHDMLGNVWEWCYDAYEDLYYARSSAVDPIGPPGGVRRVKRGGGWQGNPASARSAIRSSSLPDRRWSLLGFRVARGIPSAP